MLKRTAGSLDLRLSRIYQPRKLYASPALSQRLESIRDQRRFFFGKPKMLRVHKEYFADKAVIYKQDISRKTFKKLVTEARPEGVDLDKLDELIESMETGPMAQAYREAQSDYRGNIDFKADALYLFQYKRCGRTHQIRALLDFFNVQYIAVEVSPHTNKELENFKGELRQVPLVRVENTKMRQEARAKITASLRSLLPEKMRESIPHGASLPEVVEKVKFLVAKFSPDQREELNRKLDEFIKELDPEYGIQYFSRDNLGGLVDWLREHRFLSGRRFISDSALERVQWINRRWRPMVFLNTCKSFNRSCEFFTYVHKIPQYSKWRKELLHHWGPLYFRFVLKYRLRSFLNVKGFVKYDLWDYVDEWLESFEGQRFHGGNTPDIADVMFYGATVAYQDLDVWRELLQKTSIEPWLLRMEEEIGPTSCKMEMAIPA